MKRATALLILATALACFDPLYEDGMASGYFVCCLNGSVGTCACLPGTSCLPTFKPCAGGQCSSTLSCRSASDAGASGGGSSGTGGGSSAGGGSSSAGGLSGGGFVAAGGTSAAGGLSGGGFVAAGGTSAGGGFVTADSGTADAGTVGGGSAAGGSAAGGSAAGGSAAGGSAAGGSAVGGGTSGGGVIVEPDYELCCVSGLVTTCICAPTGCANAPFTACPSNRCVAGTATGICR